MYSGKTLFAQVMSFLPWTTFARIVDRYDGDRKVRTLRCTEHYRAMAFAQLTGRESLRDIEACLAAGSAKLYHSGFRAPVRRSMADANEHRDWRIYADFSQRLIVQARALYANEPLATELNETAYALDSTTIDLCLSIFPWATFRTTKAAVKMHTLLDLRGSIPSFIHISDGKLHDVNVLDLLVPEAGATYVMDRAYIDFQRLYALHQAGAFFVTRAKKNFRSHRLYSASTDRTLGVISDHRFGRRANQGALPRSPAAHSLQGSGQDARVSHQPDRTPCAHRLWSVQKPLAGLQMGQAAPAREALSGGLGERGQVATVDRCIGLRAGCNPPQAPSNRHPALHNAADSLGHAV